MLYVALIDNQSVAINMLKMNLITLSLWLESTKGNRFFLNMSALSIADSYTRRGGSLIRHLRKTIILPPERAEG